MKKTVKDSNFHDYTLYKPKPFNTPMLLLVAIFT